MNTISTSDIQKNLHKLENLDIVEELFNKREEKVNKELEAFDRIK